MIAAVASLAALVAGITLSVVSRVNVGVVAIALAWLIGTTLAGLKPEQLMAGFPASLFLTLTGVTLLFGLAEANGTLSQLANRALQLAGGRVRLLPVLFFLIACVLSSIGPGSISSVALLIPMAMAVGTQAGVPRFLIALMVANGANGGNLSPVSAVGVIANAKLMEAGVGEHQIKVWLANLIAHALVAGIAYILLGGHRLRPKESASGDKPEASASEVGLTRQHWVTIAVLGTWILAVVGFQVSVGLAGFTAAALLVLVGAANESEGMRRIPWGVILMVCGVTLLVSLLEKTGGMELFTSLLARLASPLTVNGVVAFVTGLISSWSSTTGVVLPAFLPTAPDLVAKVGGGDPLAVSLSIAVGASMVDVSPLSTLGALCVASVAEATAARQLFRQLLVWGLSMSLVGAALCQLFAGAFARF